MGRESSHGRKELFNLPPLVLKARAPNDGSAFCIGFSSRLEVPEQTLSGIPLGLGMVMKINFFEFSCRIQSFINPLRMRRRVTVVVLCVCLSVTTLVARQLISAVQAWYQQNQHDTSKVLNSTSTRENP